jgi:hypothetical protein
MRRKPIWITKINNTCIRSNTCRSFAIDRGAQLALHGDSYRMRPFDTLSQMNEIHLS